MLWDPIYSVNVKEIDDQHKQFIALMNHVYDVYESMETEKQMEDMFHRLNEHAQFHFATEELYFEKFHYEGAQEHVKIHHAIIDKIADFKRRYEEEGYAHVMIELIDFLEEWLTHHIVKYDKQYTRCFNEHGLY